VNWDKRTPIASELLREMRGLGGATTDDIAEEVQRTLTEVAPICVAVETRTRRRASVPPGTIRATIDTHSAELACRKVRARKRLFGMYWCAFGMGGALGTAVGLLLEALRQGWRP